MLILFYSGLLRVENQVMALWSLYVPIYVHISLDAGTVFDGLKYELAWRVLHSRNFRMVGNVWSFTSTVQIDILTSHCSSFLWQQFHAGWRRRDDEVHPKRESTETIHYFYTICSIGSCGHSSIKTEHWTHNPRFWVDRDHRYKLISWDSLLPSTQSKKFHGLDLRPLHTTISRIYDIKMWCREQGWYVELIFPAAVPSNMSFLLSPFEHFANDLH